MALPLTVPTLPQLAKSAKALPTGDGWAYEPKCDGFRCIAFVDGDEVELQSRNGRDLTRYFPDLAFPTGRYVIDGEIVVFVGDGGDGLRPARPAHPPGRVARADAGREDAGDVHRLRRAEHRRRGPARAAPARAPRAAGGDRRRAAAADAVASARPEEAEAWLHNAEGVIAKQTDAPYKPGERVGMIKIKRVRTLDAVVLGWRPGKAEGTLGALILGLYDEDGELRGIGHSSGFTAKEKKELPDRLEAVRDRRARQRRAVAVVAGPRPRVDLAAAGARRRDRVRPHVQRAHPPQRQGAALARRQAARGLHAGSADVDPVGCASGRSSRGCSGASIIAFSGDPRRARGGVAGDGGRFPLRVRGAGAGGAGRPRAAAVRRRGRGASACTGCWRARSSPPT